MQYNRGLWPATLKSMFDVVEKMEHKSRALLIPMSLAFLAVTGVLDYETGFNLSFSAFYLLDVGFAVWFIGAPFALTIAVLSIVVSQVGDWAAGAHYSTILVPIWNALILITVYLTVVWLLQRLRDAQRRLENTVQDRTRALTQEIAQRERVEKDILEISEREQRRIGHDLHDGLCQHLTATAMAGQVLGEKLAARSLPESADATELVRLIEDGITLARNTAHGIAPLEMESEGLVDALRALADNVSRTFRVACRVVCDSPPPIEDPAAATHLYRIAQEAVHNAVRHGHPKQIVVSLSRVRHRAQLTVEDDGIGLPEDWQTGRGLGTHIMAHRAVIVGGALSIEPNPTGGTFVSCSFPLPHAA